MREPEPCNVEDTLRALNPLGRYQLRQLFISCLGTLSCSYQLLGNIFVGAKVGWHQCAAPDNSSTLPSHLTHLDWWISSQVSYGQCQITVSRSNLSDDIEVFPCLFGHNYGSPRERSFRTEFDLVCDRKILGGLAQTSLIIVQGIGALSCSFPTDRFGRKKTVIASQTALTILGLAAGFAPSFPVFAVLKFAIGAAQQHYPRTPPPPTTTTTTNTTTSETTEATTSTAGDTTPNSNDTTIATNTTLDVTTTANDTTTNSNVTSECGNNSNEYPRAVPLWHMFPVIAAVILTKYIA